MFLLKPSSPLLLRLRLVTRFFRLFFLLLTMKHHLFLNCSPEFCLYEPNSIFCTMKFLNSFELAKNIFWSYSQNHSRFVVNMPLLLPISHSLPKHFFTGSRFSFAHLDHLFLFLTTELLFQYLPATLYFVGSSFEVLCRM